MESFIVFLISVLSLLLKDSDFIGMFYCFFNFGTILIIIKRFRFYRNLLLFLKFRYYPYYYHSFFFRTRDWCRKSPKPHHIQPPNSTHIWTLIRHTAVRVLVLIRITVLDLEPNPCFQIFLNISETNDRIFNWNNSKRSSGQELPFIFFELRAPTCLWGRYDPKTENFIFFYIYLLHIHSLSKTFYVSLKSYPRATFHVLVAKVYVVTGAHYGT